MAKKVVNRMKMEISALSVNESFARTMVAAFASQLNPTLEEIADLKTAVSEAVTNCVVHAYKKGKQPSSSNNVIIIECELFTTGRENGVSVTITDFGVGIQNIEKALEPFYTTCPTDERSGMGFTVMQSFMTSIDVKSNGGTVVNMTKVFEKSQEAQEG